VKCALIIPAWLPQELFPRETAGSQINYWQPLGILYIAAVLQKAGHEVRFFNGAILTHEEILRRVGEFDPRFAGIYSTTFGWYKAMHTAQALKRLNPEIFTFVGGPYPIARPEQCLQDCTHFDAVCTGEGEYTVAEVVERLESGGNLDGVLGVAFRRGAEIVKNPSRPLIEDLDSLPFPARELLPDSESYLPPPGTYQRKPVTVLMTARGCDRQCLYCFQIDKHRSAGVRGVRLRSIENVLDEIEHCLKLGYREIKFLDDSLAVDYERALRLAQAIKARGLDFTWFASACVNQVDQPLLQAFKDAGCWAILFGGESGEQKSLNAVRKGSKVDHTRAAVRAAKAAGLRVSMAFMFGIPGETYEDGLKTIEFAIELDPDLANFHALTPFPGTDLYANHAKYGTISNNLQDYTYQSAAFVPYSMTREQIHALRQLAFRRFYSRPGYLLRQLLRLRNRNDLRAALVGLKSLFWLWTRDSLFGRKASLTAPAERL
jgi:anaerobic magnesium-protoporphyrin IX monomethyl ester cyclase